MAIPFPEYKNQVEPLVKAIKTEQDSGSFFVVKSSQVSVPVSSSSDLTLSALEGVEAVSFLMKHVVVSSEDGVGGLPGSSKFDIRIYEKSGRGAGDLIYEEKNLDASVGRIVLSAETVFSNSEASPVNEVYLTVVNNDVTAKKFIFEIRCTK